MRGDFSGPARSCHGRVIGQPDFDHGVGRGRAQHLGGNIENGVTSALASEPHDHLARLHDFTWLRADRCHDAFGICLELRKDHLVVRGFKLRLGGFNIRLGRPQISLRLIEICARRPSLPEERLLPLEMIADLVLLCLRRAEVGLCHAKCIELIQGLESTECLPRLHAITHTDGPLDHAPRDSEPERCLVERLDAASHHDRDAGLALLHRRGSNRPRLRLCDHRLLFAGGERRCEQTREQD